MKKFFCVCLVWALTVIMVACRNLRTLPMGTVPSVSSAATEAGVVETEPKPAELVDSFFLPESDRRFLTAPELMDLSAGELAVARNEIYARRGYRFTDPDVAAYFALRSWYTPMEAGSTFQTDVFNKYELANVELIRVYERKASGAEFSGDNPYAEYYRADTPYILNGSNLQRLYTSDVTELTAAELCLARNEIMARHGYCFTDQHLLEYFLRQDWYAPQVTAANADTISLSETEQYNLDILSMAQERMTGIEKQGTAFTEVVTTKWFSVNIPAYWKHYGFVYQSETGVNFYENKGYESGCGGSVFGLFVFESAEEYEDYPETFSVGMLKDGNGKILYVAAMYPSDVQFDLEDSYIYGKMKLDSAAVIQSLSAAPGYTFTPAA